MSIIKNIKTLREQNELSQRELGRKIGKSGQFISLVEQGKSNPSIDTLKKIANALNVPLEVLTNDDYLKNKISIEKFKEFLSEYNAIETDSENLMNLLTKFITSSIFLKLQSISLEDSNIDEGELIFKQLKGLKSDEFINIFMSMHHIISKIIVDRKQNPVSDDELIVKFYPDEY